MEVQLNYLCESDGIFYCHVSLCKFDIQCKESRFSKTIAYSIRITLQIDIVTVNY